MALLQRIFAGSIILALGACSGEDAATPADADPTSSGPVATGPGGTANAGAPTTPGAGTSPSPGPTNSPSNTGAPAPNPTEPAPGSAGTPAGMGGAANPGAGGNGGSGTPVGGGGNAAAGAPDPGQAGAPGNEGYPPGPYGEGSPDVGDVIENLPLRGLVNLDATGDSENLTIADSSLGALRASGKRYALLITAAGWCPSCKTAARELGEELATEVKNLNDQGGLIAHILLDGTRSGTAPTDDEFVNWAKAASLRISVLGHESERVRAVFPAREWGFIVELETMKVVWREQVELYAKPTVSTISTQKLAEFLGM